MTILIRPRCSETRRSISQNMGRRMKDAAFAVAIQASEGWYRYGDSNPGPVAENHVS